MNHSGHKVIKDHFRELAGVRRLVSGEYWCLDCKEPVDVSNIIPISYDHSNKKAGTT